MNLTGKVTLVTGASRGIGRQIALTLAGYGATVIVNYNGSAAKAEEVVNEITANGGMAESMQCSVSDFEKSKEMIDGIVKKYGRLDILVNNAGITKDNLIMKMSEDDFDAVIATNLRRIQLHQTCLPPDVKAERRTDHQHLLRFRSDGKCRPGKLLRI
mgnify:CR=1 FL=1